MLDPGQTALSGQTHVAKSDRDPLFIPAARIVRPGVETQHTPGLALGGRTITPSAAAAREDDFQDPPFTIGAGLASFPPEPLLIRRRKTQNLFPCPQTRHMALPETWASLYNGQGLEQAVTILQPTIRERYLRGSPSVNQQRVSVPAYQTRRNARVPLVPPNPKELEITTSSAISLAVFGT